MKKIGLILILLMFTGAFFADWRAHSANLTAGSKVRAISNPASAKTEFDAILADPANPIVCAEFFSPGCPHCRNFARAGIFENVAGELPNVRFVTISSGSNDDADAGLAKLHADNQITSYPTFIVYQNGKKMGKRMGFQHKEPLKRFINESIGK